MVATESVRKFKGTSAQLMHDDEDVDAKLRRLVLKDTGKPTPKALYGKKKRPSPASGEQGKRGSRKQQ
jgi:hypothetical protein